MTAETIHTCSYSCERPECIRAQRDELAARMTAETSNARGGGGGDMEVPFVAISNDELGPPIGDTVACRVCGSKHPVEYGTSRRMLDDGTWSEPKPSRLLGVYKCGEKLYLASVDGRQV